MSARYIFRLDDITPRMHWERFWALLSLLKAHNIKPLLGLIPDNQDRSLDVSNPYPDFWGIMRKLQDDDSVDFAQHGFQHILSASTNAILGPELGIKEMSEFAGFSYETQREKIKNGKDTLRERGIFTTAWMAPNHSFDHNTLTALRDEGFQSVTDGIALFPFSSHGLIFVPQQSWKPRWMPCGVQTICIHTNEITPSMVRKVRHFLRRPYLFSRFADEVRHYRPSAFGRALDSGFETGYRLLRTLRRRAPRGHSSRATRSRPGTDSRLATTPLLPSRLGS